MTIHLPTADLRPHHVPVDGGRIIRHLGSQMRFLETTETTAGQFWLAEQTSERGVASPVHRHTHEDETFVVLDGELEVGVGDESIVLGEREVRFAPRGLPHTFRVVSPQARFLILGTPARFENWFFETADEPDSPPEAPPDFGRLIGALAKYDVEFIAPPPGMMPGGPPR